MLGGLSRERHLGYLKPFQSNDNRNVYLVGYLLVRSVVARWETTLGRRLRPVVAVKALLLLTRVSTYQALADPCTEISLLEKKSEELFVSWLDVIAEIEGADLKDVFQPANDARGGRMFRWEENRISVVADPVQSSQEGFLLRNRLVGGIRGLFGSQGSESAEGGGPYSSISGRDQNSLKTIIESLFDLYAEYMTLLPVGRDWSRLLIPNQNEAEIAICVRNYVSFGVAQPENVNSWQRYSPRTFILKAGTGELRRLREACADQRSGRVLATRVIDFAAERHHFKSASMSLVCFFAGDDWNLVLPGYLSTVNEYVDDPAYIRLLKGRVSAPGFFAEEQNTLSSALFLTECFKAAGRISEFTSYLEKFDPIRLSVETALSGAVAAFNTEKGILEGALEELSDNAACRIISGYLHTTGRDGTSTVAVPGDFPAVFFDPHSHSGIKPYKSVL